MQTQCIKLLATSCIICYFQTIVLHEFIVLLVHEICCFRHKPFHPVLLVQYSTVSFIQGCSSVQMLHGIWYLFLMLQWKGYVNMWGGHITWTFLILGQWWGIPMEGIRACYILAYFALLQVLQRLSQLLGASFSLAEKVISRGLQLDRQVATVQQCLIFLHST